MSDSVGMYVGIALGSTALFGVCVGILYRKHQQDLKVLRQQEQIIRDRFQHVAGTCLPSLDLVFVFMKRRKPLLFALCDPLTFHLLLFYCPSTSTPPPHSALCSP